MTKPFSTRLGWTQRPRNGDPDVRTVYPHGGVMTAHPVGILVLAAAMGVFLYSIPAARVFTLMALGLGSLVGLVLWLRHR